MTSNYTDLGLVRPAEEDDGGDDDEAEEDGEDQTAHAARRGLANLALSSPQGFWASGCKIQRMRARLGEFSRNLFHTIQISLRYSCDSQCLKLTKKSLIKKVFLILIFSAKIVTSDLLW